MNYSPPGSSVHGISQAKILEWVVVPFSKGSSWPRDWTQVSCAGDSLLHCRHILYWLSHQLLDPSCPLVKGFWICKTGSGLDPLLEMVSFIRVASLRLLTIHPHFFVMMEQNSVFPQGHCVPLTVSKVLCVRPCWLLVQPCCSLGSWLQLCLWWLSDTIWPLLVGRWLPCCQGSHFCSSISYWSPYPTDDSHHWAS